MFVLNVSSDSILRFCSRFCKVLGIFKGLSECNDVVCKSVGLCRKLPVRG